MSPTITTRDDAGGNDPRHSRICRPSSQRPDGRCPADVWASGVVLFEMVSGQRAFDGEDIADVLGAVVRLGRWTCCGSVPPRVQVLRGCLQKNVKARLAHSGRALVLEARSDDRAADGWHGLRQPAAARRLPWLVAAGMAVIAVAASAALWRSTRPVSALRPPCGWTWTSAPTFRWAPQPADHRPTARGSCMCHSGSDPARSAHRYGDGRHAGRLCPVLLLAGRAGCVLHAGSLRKISVEGGTAIVLSPG